MRLVEVFLDILEKVMKFIYCNLEINKTLLYNTKMLLF